MPVLQLFQNTYICWYFKIRIFGGIFLNTTYHRPENQLYRHLSVSCNTLAIDSEIGFGYCMQIQFGKNILWNYIIVMNVLCLVD